MRNVKRPYSTVFILMIISCLATHVSAQNFTDRAVPLGINVDHQLGDIIDDQWGTGAAWIDYDQDGDLDLYVSNRGAENKFYENQTVETGTLSFTDVTATVNLACVINPAANTTCDGAGISVGDYNNDGYPDIYLATAQEDVFYQNNGGFTFSDVTASVLGTGDSHLTGLSRGTSVTWLDFDNDGYLDLYVSHHVPAKYYPPGHPNVDTSDYLLHNHEGQYFEDASFLIDQFNRRWGSGFISCWTDMDQDGDYDLIASNDCVPSGGWPLQNIVYENLGPSGNDWSTWQFDTVQLDVGMIECDNVMGIASGDVNHDGYIDLATTNIGPVRLWKNNNGFYQNIAISGGVAVQDSSHYSWGINFGDMDLDGWLDLLVTSGNLDEEPSPMEEDLDQNNYYLHNDGIMGNGESYTDFSDAHNYNDITRGRTSITADADNDGDLDVYIVNYNSRAQYKQNNLANGNHWLKINLDGVISNRDGVGARVKVVTPSFDQYAEAKSGSSLGGGDSPYLHFGLGANAVISEIEVTWPSGIIQSLSNIPSDTLITILEDVGLPSNRVFLTSRQIDDGVKLDWDYSGEIPSDFLVLKRDRSGRKIAEYIVPKNDNGQYSFYDPSPVVGVNYYQVTAGVVSSNIVKERYAATQSRYITPTLSSGLFHVRELPADLVKLEVISQSGVICYTAEIENAADVSIDLSHLASGAYHIRLRAQELYIVEQIYLMH